MPARTDPWQWSSEALQWWDVGTAVVASVLGVIALAGGVTGFMLNRLRVVPRILLFLAAILLLAPNVGGPTIGLMVNGCGGLLLGFVAFLNRTRLAPARLED